MYVWYGMYLRTYLLTKIGKVAPVFLSQNCTQTERTARRLLCFSFFFIFLFYGQSRATDQADHRSAFQRKLCFRIVSYRIQLMVKAIAASYNNSNL